MISLTILSGKEITGFLKKQIVHPYSGASPDAVAYAREITIPAFAGVKDMRVFRTSILSAALNTCRYLEKNKKKILEIVSRETGSPLSYHAEDLHGVCEFLKNIKHLEKLLSKKYLFEPKGNVLLILSANEPLITTTLLVFSALFMGNTVFVKPSSKTPSYAFLLIKKLAKIPALRKKAHYLMIDAEETERLIRSRAFDFVLSLGGRPTNKKLGVMCAEAEVEFLPESEGNDWVYIDKNCGSLGKIGKLLVHSFIRHNGQMCNSVRGILVHAACYDSLLPQLKKNIAKLSLGDPRRKEISVGALLSGTAANAQSLVDNASKADGEVWNFSIENNSMAPTLIMNPAETSSIFSESIFAPVLWIKKVKNHREAIAFYNKKNPHGLGFSVFSKDKKIAAECVHAIRAGRINVNRHPLDIALLDPLGGIKLSGRGGPSHWIEKLSNRKHVP